MILKCIRIGPREALTPTLSHLRLTARGRGSRSQ